MPLGVGRPTTCNDSKVPCNPNELMLPKWYVLVCFTGARRRVQFPVERNESVLTLQLLHCTVCISPALISCMYLILRSHQHNCPAKQDCEVHMSAETISILILHAV